MEAKDLYSADKRGKQFSRDLIHGTFLQWNMPDFRNFRTKVGYLQSNPYSDVFHTLTLILGSVKLVHIAISSLTLMSGYRFLVKRASSSWSCWEVKCVRCRRCLLDMIEFLLALQSVLRVVVPVDKAPDATGEVPPPPLPPEDSSSSSSWLSGSSGLKSFRALGSGKWISLDTLHTGQYGGCTIFVQGRKIQTDAVQNHPYWPDFWHWISAGLPFKIFFHIIYWIL